MLTARRAALIISSAWIMPALFMSSCGPSRSVSVLEGTPADCRLIAARGGEADTVRVALAGRVRPGRAPMARNPSERFVFGHIYETLIGVDCLGEVVPVLASSWRRAGDGAEWVFTIDPDAEFSDGSPVTAGDVVRCWSRWDAKGAVRAAGVDSAIAEGEKTLRVRMSREHGGVPLVLATGPFAVSGAGRRWPAGSGPYAVRPEDPGPGARYAGPVTIEPAPGYRGPAVRFYLAAGRDPRDLVESGTDLMIAGDRDVIEYARTRPGLEAVPLPWDRAYVLLSTTRVKALRWGGSPASLSKETRDDLAATAVRAEARGCAEPFWWEDIRGCPTLVRRTGWRPEFSHAAYNLDGEQRILYDASDDVARDLAERMVALSAAGPGTSEEAERIRRILPGSENDRPERMPGGPGEGERREEAGGGADALIAPYRLSAAGVSREELEESMRAGKDFAYIVSLPRSPADPCSEALSLIERAAWLGDLGDRFHEAIVPLVDTRRHVVYRPGGFGLEIDRFGRLTITGRPERGE